VNAQGALALWLFGVCMSLFLIATAAGAQGDPERGARAFAACAACHSLEADRHLTGPSLARLFGRKAGSLESFKRYSEALKAAAVVWNEETLDAWIADPADNIPGNEMVFPGVGDPETRRDLIAYLEAASSDGAPGAPGPRLRNLKDVGPSYQVRAIRYCPDTYYLTMANGDTHTIWEFNLRFKTDSSAAGPPPGEPVLLASGMMGDRGFVIFAAPEEIGTFIRREC